MIELKNNSGNLRLDKLLMREFPAAKMSEIYRWIRSGKIKVNGKKKKINYKVNVDDVIKVFVAEPEKFEKPLASRITFEVLYEDNDLLIVNKPAFLASQSGIGVMKNNLVEQVKHYLKGKYKKIALGNRLDRETSGIVVLGKHPEVNHKLYALYKEGLVEKHYLTLVVGRIKEKKGILKDYLKKKIKNFQHCSEICDEKDYGAKYAELRFDLSRYIGNYSLFDVKLITGRMHQIRAQFASRGAPVLGDDLYGDKKENKKWAKELKRQFLHASKIKFKHPITGKRLLINAPLPKDLENLLKKLK
jgi:23S rRNA pseudouridine955/2504/2580 synthase